MKTIGLVNFTASAALLAASFSVSAAETTQYMSSGDFIGAGMTYSDGCSYVSVGLNAGDTMSKSAPGAPVKSGPNGSIWVYKSNWCTWEFAWGWGEIAVSQYKVAGNLASATVVGTANVTMWDTWGNTTVVPYTVDVNVLGTSDLSSGSNTNTGSYGKIRVQSRTMGSYRYGSASGLIASGTDSYKMDSSNSWGSLSSGRSHSIVITRD